MIFILTLSYLLLIWAIYFRLRLLPFNLTNKIGVALVGFVLIVGLVLATNYCHPHSSDVRVMRYVIPIAPNLPVPSQVIDVPVQPNVPVKKGEVLFRLDPRPFEYEVRRLEAALAAASTDAPKLEADLKISDAGVAAARANLATAEREMERRERLRTSDAISQEELEEARRAVESNTAAHLQALAGQERARLALESKVSGEFTSVAQVKQNLAAARLNLEQTSVTAPDNGFVTNLAIRPGLMVAPAQAVMSFVSSGQNGVVIATFPQNPLRNIQPGGKAEIIFAMRPGKVFKADVESVIEITGQGQMTASGDLPEATTAGERGRFAVRLKLSNEDLAQFPGGASGSAVVYTDTLRPLGVIQKMAIRMEGYANYLTGF